MSTLYKGSVGQLCCFAWISLLELCCANANLFGVKVVLVGEENTGKTTMFRALTSKEEGASFDEKYKPSIGPPRSNLVAKSSNSDIEVELFDTGGQLRHRAYGIRYKAFALFPPPPLAFQQG